MLYFSWLSRDLKVVSNMCSSTLVKTMNLRLFSCAALKDLSSLFILFSTERNRRFCWGELHWDLLTQRDSAVIQEF